MLQLSRTRLFVLGTLVAAMMTVTVGVPEARAFYCDSACGGYGSQCGKLAVQVGKGCRLACKATFPEDADARRACADGCDAQVDVDRFACEGDLADCRGICGMAASAECADELCSPPLKQCRAAVRSATRACVKAAGRDGVAIQACIEPGDALLGTGRAGLEDCLTNMTTGLAACVSGC